MSTQEFIPHGQKEQKLDELLAATKKQLLICSPYVTNYGMSKVKSGIGKEIDFGLITTLKVKDCISGSHDPASILRVMAAREKLGSSDKLWINQSLHAKCYLFDDARSILGSLNFTRGGWVKNIEIATILQTEATPSLIEMIKNDILASSVEMSVTDLKNWIEDAEINQKKSEDEKEQERLNQLQNELDKKYKLSGEIEIEKYFDLQIFIEWLRDNQKLLGAKKILSQHTRSDGNNLSGHVARCFYGTVLFFKYHAHFLPKFEKCLDVRKNEDMPYVTDALRNEWVRFLRSNREVKFGDFNLQVTYRILPPSWGGQVQGGGGGSATIARMLPLVAHWINH